MRTVAVDRNRVNERTHTIGEIVEGRPEFTVLGNIDTPISGIEYDSRAVEPGDLFVALVGGYFDGHDFVQSAIERGAAAVLVQRTLDVTVPQILANDTRAGLAPIAASFFEHPSRELEVIGVTGTDGKTTTSHLIETIFSSYGMPTGMMGTIAVRVGNQVIDADTRQTTPESVDVQRHLRTMSDLGVQVAIVEATSHGLDLHRLDHVRFRTAAVTSITHEHLEHHGTVEVYRRAKARLFEKAASAGGTAVINLDDPGARGMLAYTGRSRVITYSLANQDADVHAKEITLDAGGSRFTVSVAGQEIAVETKLVGEFNVANALCAIGVAVAHDISLEHCAHALATIAGVSGRMESIRRGQSFSVIVDYAHTPDSIEKVLTLLRRLTRSGRLILVMGSAGERDRAKRPMQGAVGARLADLCIFTTEDPRFEEPDSIIAEIAGGAHSAGAIEGSDYICITDRREAIAYALTAARSGDCVLLAGKGHERSIIWQHEKRPWNEAAVAAELLELMGFIGELA